MDKKPLGSLGQLRLYGHGRMFTKDCYSRARLKESSPDPQEPTQRSGKMVLDKDLGFVTATDATSTGPRPSLALHIMHLQILAVATSAGSIVAGLLHGKDHETTPRALTPGVG